jgi:MYXO-CTERM domain-containing protein
VVLSAALRRLARVASLAALAVAGFLLGSCGGGDSALTTGTGLTATRPARTESGPVVTRTTPTLTAPTRTNESPVTTASAPSTTESSTTDTEPSEPPVTEPPETVTTVETETTLIPVPTTTAATAEPASSTDGDTPWGWIALALALAAAAVLALVLWRRRHTKAASWNRRLDDLSRRSLLALDDVVAQGSLVTGELQTLADEARSLESSAPDDQSSPAAAALRVRLDDLAAALEADRKLRLGSTPPSEEQLAYSTALVHHEVEQLQSHLRAGASSA